MKKDVTNFEIVNFVNILNEFSEKILPQKISFAIVKNIIILQQEFEAYNKSLNNLIKTFDNYIIKDDAGNIMKNNNGMPMLKNQEKLDEFTKELNELLNCKCMVDLYVISDDLFNYDNNDKYDSLSALDIIKLQSVLCIKGGDSIEAKEE